MSLTLRRATLADIATLVEFNRRLAHESEGKTLDNATLTAGVTAVLNDPSRGVYFVAEAGGEVVGQLMITTEWSDWRNGWFWWIQSVYVSADFRRQGVFRALFDQVLADAQAAGNVVGLRLYVEHQNHDALATYERMGLRPAEYYLLQRWPL